MVDISERDARMSKMIRDGHSTAEIAAAIGVKEPTVIRRLNLLHGAGRLPPNTRWGSGQDKVESQAKLIALVKAGTRRSEICRIMGRSASTINQRILLLKDEGLIGDDADESPMPKGDHDGFMKALRKTHVEGAGEMTDVPREPIGRFYPQPRASGVGSPQQLCAEN